MKRKNMTRNALVTSIISLLLCVTMLVGSTFAWFTDTVVSGNNVITAGNLDIDVQYYNGSWNTVNAATDLFSSTKWEPGHTEVVYLKVVNQGTLALNYQLGINVISETQNAVSVLGNELKLSNYIQFGVVEGKQPSYATRSEAVGALTSSKALNAGYTKAAALEAGAETYLALVVYMPETVGNEANYRGVAPSIDLGINVVATQKVSESDSFGNDYDVLAQGGHVSDTAPEAGTTKEYTVYAKDANGNNTNVKAATMNIPAAALEDGTENVEIYIVPTAQNSNVTVNADQKARTYDISVVGVKEGNTEEIQVELYVGTGLTGVKMYHNATEIPCTYNASNGYVKFSTTSFSPYTIVHDAVAAAPEGGETNPSDLPVANVTRATQYENVELEWGNYGEWSPTEGLSSKLEAAYTFACVDTLAAAQASAYANWYCDFFVSLDRDLGENQIFLGGNYGDFGWVGFHNGDVTLKANEEIGLLQSVTVNPWTYQDIVNFVREFTCGVGHVGTALDGATFKVQLRLTNPENEAEFYNVKTITYTFGGNNQPNELIDTAEELEAALIAGGNVQLGANISLNKQISIPAGVTTTLDLNNHVITCTNTATETFNQMFYVVGNLTVKNGTITMTHSGENMAYNKGTGIFTVTAGGVLNIANATVDNQGGTDMNFAVHLNNWGEVTLNVQNSTLKATYIPVRVFNSGNDMNNVTIEGSTLNGGSYSFWVHNYTEADFGTAESAAAHAALLNFKIIGNGNTFITGKAAPIRYGFTNSILFNAEGEQV